jgi:fatty acid desaturase
LSNLSTLAVASAPPDRDYADLKRTIRSAGLLTSQPRYYAVKTVALAVLLLAALAPIYFVQNVFLLLLDAAFLGFATTQIGLLSHDVCHRQGYRGKRTNAFARHILGNLFLGISSSWWIDKHNQHHASPNHTDDDPDIQMPMFVFSAEQIERRPRYMRPLIAIQAFVFPALLPLQAINMRIQGVRHLIERRPRSAWLEGVLMAAHFALYAVALTWFLGWPMAIAFFCVYQAVFGFYNSSIFASNHKGMAMTSDDDRWGFLREQVLTSRNVRSNLFVDFWYGGLNFQIEHHLFPTMPRNNLRKAQRVVREFCAERGISYEETGLFRSYSEILKHLHQVSAPLRGRARAGEAAA